MNTGFSFPSLSQGPDLTQLGRAIRRINSPLPLPKVEVREFAGWRLSVHDRKGPEGRSVTHSISPFYDRQEVAFDPWAMQALIGPRGHGLVHWHNPVGRDSHKADPPVMKWFIARNGQLVRPSTPEEDLRNLLEMVRLLDEMG